MERVSNYSDSTGLRLSVLDFLGVVGAKVLSTASQLDGPTFSEVLTDFSSL
jgi:hypothetical protein